jgi:hypothetical protein
MQESLTVKIERLNQISRGIYTQWLQGLSG